MVNVCKHCYHSDGGTSTEKALLTERIDESEKENVCVENCSEEAEFEGD